MRIYAIADLHLSLVSEKPMDVFGEAWRDHADKIDRNWREVVREDDLVLIPETSVGQCSFPPRCPILRL
jgi:predicted phosphohydrolase